MREALKFVAGSCVVYAVMAACSGKAARYDDDDDSSPHHSSGGSSTLAMTGGAPGAGGVAQAGDTNGPGQMGASGQAEGTGAAGGNEPRDAGMMDAMTDAMTDPTPDASAQEMSGTRLKARYYVGADGSKQFAGWYDTSRKENCTVMTASDGKLRCLPSAFFATGGSYFSDDGCSQKLFYTVKASASTACAPAAGSLGYGYYTDGCGYSFYTLTATVPGVVYTGTPASCSGIPAPTDTFNFYTGAQIDPATFVAMTDETE